MASENPIVLIIDEVDSATNNQVFLDLLGILRDGFISREKDGAPAFQSVILAGVTDVKHLKNKIREEDKHKENSPWNIAADFLVDMSLSENGIRKMLEEYQTDHGLEMNASELAKWLRDYTNGYPYLVSRICQLIDTQVTKEVKNPVLAWSKTGFEKTVKILLSESNTLFESLTSKLENMPEMKDALRSILIKGEKLVYPSNTARLKNSPVCPTLRFWKLYDKIMLSFVYGGGFMARVIATGVQDFAELREKNAFYVDKTAFIKEWWNGLDSVTLITRPRRFGKTLNLSMLECFFSNKYEGRADLFEGLDVWNDEKFRKLQGTYPVIFLSFAGVKQTTYEKTRNLINELIVKVFVQYDWILKEDCITEKDREFFARVSIDMDDVTAALSINTLCGWLCRYYGKKCIVLLDEYDTPMQEAYINGFWDELVAYTRALFNNTFKTNPSLERAVMTGITRVSKESIFSDLNNLTVVTTTSDRYAKSFGFTEEEVFAAMDEQGVPEEEKEKVKFWYDGFTFGKIHDIYNPWSVTVYLNERKYDTHWANTSGNGLVGKLIREGDKGIKTEFEKLLNGDFIEAKIDEQIVFSQLSGNRNAIWSLLLASGYLKVVSAVFSSAGKPTYQLALTNYEVKCMFETMIEGWFAQTEDFGEFVSAMFKGDIKSMNRYMNKVALNTFSYFDAGNKPSGQREPERFYHGFVLGLIVDKAKDYVVKSNRESGYGRYDVVMEPKDAKNAAVIMEFKVFDTEDDEKELADTAENALKQIEDRKYDTDLLQRGIPAENILKYGFAFEGEKCLIKKA